jgi:hypothetical protein
MAPKPKKPPKKPGDYVARRPVGEGSIRLSPTYGVDFGDQSLWATSIVTAKAAAHAGKKYVKAVDLEEAISGIKINDSIHSASTIVVSFEDPDWKLIRSGFFDANADGRLDSMDVNYPLDSDLWWRCTQISINANRVSASIEMTFIERTVAYLLSKKGQAKTSRAKKTRAEFIGGLVGAVKVRKLHFHCEELHEKQEQERDKKKTDKTPSLLVIPTDSGGGNPRNTDAEAGAQKRKKKGVNWSKADVTIKGAKPDTEQTEAIEICMGVADRLHASAKAVKAMVVAGIGESSFRPSEVDRIYGTHKGVFQSGQIDQFDTEQQCTYFFKGGRSFLAGGAMGLVKSQPSLSVGTVAAKVEISDSAGPYYDGFAGEADKIIEAFGGAGAGTTPGDTGGEYRKQFNFEVGGPDHPGESYWEAMQRLAGDVKWALFVDGTHVYYDAETTLIRQKPAAYINRLDEAVVSFSSTWDQRNIASEASLDLICDPFEFRAGDTIKLIGFGPSSTGSSVRPPLPGRWLVAEIDRDRFDFVSTLRLVQPTKPGPEPQPQTGTHQAGEEDNSAGVVSDGVAKDIVEWAKAQVGTTEGSAKHQKWAGDLGYSTSLPWCSIFIGYGIKHSADLPLPLNPAYSGAWLDWSGGTEVSKSQIVPGDIVVFDWGDGGLTDHVALYVGGGQVIGGNQSNKVSRVPWNKARTVGVVHPHYTDAPSGGGVNRNKELSSEHGWGY